MEPSVYTKGQRFGDLTILRLYTAENRHITADCLCSCGGSRTIRVGDLERGRLTNLTCGCFGLRVGQTVGRMTIVAISDLRGRFGRVATLECGCGSTRELPCARVHNRAPTGRRLIRCSPGCSHGGLSCTAKKWEHIKAGARSRGIRVTVTREEVSALLDAQGARCVYTGVPLSMPPTKGWGCTASLDRIDSSRGYERDNVQWVHKVVNVMKQELGDAEFIEWCRAVADGPRAVASKVA